ncbi:MAG TPA: tetratricopeptide repeat protein [Phycisphaerae bacterium]|nr:tetratricopeptide repeat protein [Phycisphaerae bacterium]HNU45029.1 tetratricopeptide repeat protein [Phycisphaerae bacterium]
MWATKHFTLILVVICAVSLLCRLAILYEYVQRNPLSAVPINDARTYWEWGERIAAGQLTEQEPFFSAPFYPYLVGLVRALGGGLPLLYVLQTLATISAACLTAFGARRRCGALPGLLAAVLLLLLLDPASLALRVLSGSWELLLAALLWVLLTRLQDTWSTWRAVAAGVVLGLFCLAYAPGVLLLVLVPMCVLLECPNRRAGVRSALMTLAAALVSIAPATVHNLAAGGELYLVRAGGGITLRQGNYPGSRGEYTLLPGISAVRGRMHEDAACEVRQATGVEPSWRDVDRYYRRQVWDYWRGDPRRAVRLAATKAYWFLVGDGYGDIYEPRAEMAAGLAWCLWLTPLPVAWVSGLAVLGAVVALRHPIRNAPGLLLLGVPWAVVIVFFYSPRYRVVALPTLVVLAAWVAVEVVRGRARSRLAVAAGVALLGGVLVGFANRAAGFDQPDRAALRFHLASALNKQGRTAEAIMQQQQGVTLRPEDAEQQWFLGRLLSKSGRAVEGLVPLQRARALAPEHARIRLDLARTLFHLQRFDEAERLLTEAVARDANDAGSLSLLAEIRQLRGQGEEACALYEQALAADPATVVIRYSYATLLLGMQRTDDAQRHFEWVLRLDPRNVGALYNLGVLALQRDDYTSARTHLEQALALGPTEVAVLHGLGVACVGLGERERGTEYFRRALAIDPKYVPSREALERLDEAAARPTPQNPP